MYSCVSGVSKSLCVHIGILRACVYALRFGVGAAGTRFDGTSSQMRVDVTAKLKSYRL